MKILNKFQTRDQGFPYWREWGGMLPPPTKKLLIPAPPSKIPHPPVDSLLHQKSIPPCPSRTK